MKSTEVQLRDGVIKNYLVEFLNDENSYVADKAFKKVKVSNKVGVYATIGKESRKNYDIKYIPGTVPATFTFSYSTKNYVVEDHVVKFDAAWDVIKNQQEPIDVEKDVARHLTQIHLNAKEAEAASVLQDAASFGSNAGTPATLWDANGNFVSDINDAVLTVQKATGKRPNLFIVSRPVFEALKENTYFTNRNFLTGSGITAEEAIKSALGAIIGMEVVVADATYDAAGLGGAPSNTFFFGKNAWALYQPKNASLLNPSFGLQPFMDEYSVRTYKIDERRTTGVESSESYGFAANYELGYFFENVIS